MLELQWQRESVATMTDQPRPDAEEPAIVRKFREAVASGREWCPMGNARELVAHLDALKARASEPSERERDLMRALESAYSDWWNEASGNTWQAETERLLGRKHAEPTNDALKAERDRLQSELTVARRSLEELNEERDRLQSELSEARAAATKARQPLQSVAWPTEDEKKLRIAAEMRELAAAQKNERNVAVAWYRRRIASALVCLARRDGESAWAQLIDAFDNQPESQLPAAEAKTALLMARNTRGFTNENRDEAFKGSWVTERLDMIIAELQPAAECAECGGLGFVTSSIDIRQPTCDACQGTGKKPTEEKTECDGCARARSGDYFITTGDPATVQCPKCNAVHPRDAKEGHPIERLTRDDNDAKQLKRLSGTAVLSGKIDDYDTRWAILTLVEYLREERRAR
jgi:F0F1-type ATP synthase membrane subunit b/b'